MRPSTPLFLSLAAFAFAGCATTPVDAPASGETQAQPKAALAATAVPGPTSTPDPDLGTLKITDQVLGTGDEAAAGKKVTVNYTGRLLTGAQFDSSVGRAPFTFTMGQGQVIKGWDMGLAGMKVGGKRELVIPPYLAYGAEGAGPIPPNATLVFDIELLSVQ